MDQKADNGMYYRYTHRLWLVKDEICREYLCFEIKRIRKAIRDQIAIKNEFLRIHAK